MYIEIDRHAKTPIYLQLKHHLERLIHKGTFPAGYKLPASRELAGKLGLNRGTVINAYAELEAEGLVHSHIGQGTFVCEDLDAGQGEPFLFAEPKLARSKVWRGVFAKRIGRIENREEATFQSVRIQDDSISFASGAPDKSLFPVHEFARATTAALKKHAGEILLYGGAQGYFPLRQWVSARLTRFGVEAEPEEVTIVSGSQQALDLVGRLLLDPEDLVVMEDPTYFGALNAFSAYQATYLSVPREPAGLDLGAMENVLAQHRPKFLYVIPAFHYPTGYCMNARARRGLMDLLERYQVPFVEDDFCAHLRYEGAIEPALKSIDKLSLGIYVGSFSKTLFPGLRVGWIVAPREVTERLLETKQACDLRSGAFVQAAAYEFCKRGGYDRHMKIVREVYRHRRDVMLGALERHMPEGCHWAKPLGGLSVWVTLPQGVDARELLAETGRSGVLFAPGSLFSPFRGGESTMRLCFGSLEPDAIERGISIIGRAIARWVRRTKRVAGIGDRESLALP